MCATPTVNWKTRFGLLDHENFFFREPADRNLRLFYRFDVNHVFRLTHGESFDYIIIDAVAGPSWI